MTFNKKEYNKKYRENHREELKNYLKKWEKNNPEKVKRYRKKHYLKNKEKINKKHKEYYQNNKIKRNKKIDEWQRKNPKKVKKYMKKYCQKNKGKRTKKSREYYQENKNNLGYKLKKNKYRRKKYQIDKNFNIMDKLRRRINYALTKYTETGKIMTSKQYGISYKAIIEYLEPFPEDYLISKSKYHIHHNKPLFTFDFINPDGSTNLEEVKKAWKPDNLKLVTQEEHKKIHRKLNHMELKNEILN